MGERRSLQGTRDEAPGRGASPRAPTVDWTAPGVYQGEDASLALSLTFALSLALSLTLTLTLTLAFSLSLFLSLTLSLSLSRTQLAESRKVCTRTGTRPPGFVPRGVKIRQVWYSNQKGVATRPHISLSGFISHKEF